MAERVLARSAVPQVPSVESAVTRSPGTRLLLGPGLDRDELQAGLVGAQVRGAREPAAVARQGFGR